MIRLAACLLLAAAPAAAQQKPNAPLEVTDRPQTVASLRCTGEYAGAALAGIMTQTYLRTYGHWVWAGAFTEPGGDNYVFEGNGDQASAIGWATGKGIDPGDHRRATRIRLDMAASGFSVADLDEDRTGGFTCG